ncbi:5'-nucleotidase C-terminal domain-containing protein [Devriesea agamarum]|uniref:5'-nucleotidase C-terminal domain-containing protein n=1 Tax=Devriesea agamarum TaxID=472569 RepID=UPI00071CA1E6|nr:5'-nucleotidase C-terminal domain-containing protein [Devriesea agamarum]
MSPSCRRRGRTLTAALATGILLLPVSLTSAVAAPTTFTLFNINDFHGRIDSSALNLACTLETQRAKAPASAFLSAGDNIGASEFSSFIADDNPTIDYLNALDLDASALGNHEFDGGYDALVNRVEKRSKFPLLGANVFHRDGRPAAKPYVIVKAGEVRVAVVGAVTEQTASLVTPSGIADIQFKDPVDSVNAVIDTIPAADYDVLVVEYHEGAAVGADSGKAPQTDDQVFTKMVEKTSPKADAIYNGHTHVRYDYEAKVPGTDRTRPIIQAASYGELLSKVTFQYDKASDRLKLVTNELLATKGADLAACDAAKLPRYHEAKKIVEKAKAAGEVKGAKIVGSLDADITTAWGPQIATYKDGFWRWNGQGEMPAKGDDRGRGSALSDLLAESMRWSTQQKNYASKRADIGVMNPGGVRADMFYKASGSEGDGKITYREANDVIPFANGLSTVDLTGAQVKTLLEQQWQRDIHGAVPSRSYIQLGLSKNVSYTFDSTRPEGQRITSVHIDGKALDPHATYTVVSASFLINGGDNFHVLTKGKNMTDTGLVDRDAWIDYLGAHRPTVPPFAARGLETSQPRVVGTDLVIDVKGLESLSLGAPQIAQATATIGKANPGTANGTATGTKPLTAPYRDGVAQLRLPLDALAASARDQAGAKVVDLHISSQPNTGTDVMLTVTLPQPSKAAFTDVKPGTAFYNEISWMNQQGISTGYPDGTYRPGAPATREAMMAFLYRRAGSPKVSLPDASPFTDVAPTSPFYREIIWAKNTGIANGFSDGTFRPKAPAQRNAVAAFLFRASGSPKVDLPTSSPFTDVAPTDPFYREIVWLHKAKVARGWSVDNGYEFRSWDPIHRDAAAAMLNRLV